MSMKQTLFVRAGQAERAGVQPLRLPPEMSSGLQSAESVWVREKNCPPARFPRRNDYKSAHLPPARVVRIFYRE
jgi:hypothetical protein